LSNKKPHIEASMIGFDDYIVYASLYFYMSEILIYYINTTLYVNLIVLKVL